MVDKSAIPKEQDRQREHYADQADSFECRGILGSRDNRCHMAKVRRIIKWLNLSDGSRLLEVGTGTGLHASWIGQSLEVSYTGVDLSPVMLEIARKRLGQEATLIEAPAEDIPYEDAFFDGVFCSGALHHVADKRKAVSEMARVVKHGGRVVLSEPNPINPVNAFAWITNRFERGQTSMRLSLFSQWMSDAGLVPVHSEFFNFTPPKPEAFLALFDSIDGVGNRIPLVRRIGSMILFVGEKRPS